MTLVCIFHIRFYELGKWPTLLPHQWSMKDLLVEVTVNSIKREMITQKKERKKKRFESTWCDGLGLQIL